MTEILALVGENSRRFEQKMREAEHKKVPREEYERAQKIYERIMESEQRKLAEIGGKPCEWSPEEWAAWSAKDED